MGHVLTLPLIAVGLMFLYAYIVGRGAQAKAQTILDEAVSLGPDDDMARVNLALACYELGDLDDATGHLQHAVEINPWNARAVADLANCLCACGQAKQAIQLCDSFLSAR